jgi:signal transduction histidine kinase
MNSTYIFLIYFFYGLAFFSMGLAILLEIGHGSEQRLRRALLPLAAFGIIHGLHEWLEMFERLGVLPGQATFTLAWDGIRLAILAFSFLSLAAFGVYLMAKTIPQQRISLLVPLLMAAIWGLGLFIMRGIYSPEDIVSVSDVWTRYSLAIPAAILASVGLVVQQREFRQAGLAQFGRDALWAAIAFFWYGVAGQAFPRAGPLPPSNVINQGLFQEVFGFPVQLMRAVIAVVAAVFVMRFLRSFEVEIKNKIAGLQAARLEEAQRREALRGDLLRQIVQAQEAERQRVARELHDETGQALTAIGLGLRGVSSNISQNGDKVSQNLRRLEGLVDRSLIELQRLIADLRPSHLDDLGLPAALRWYAGEVQGRVPLQINVEVVGEQRQLPSEMKTALFRIVQEALTNTIKHAKAKTAEIRLVFDDRVVTVSVMDDGRGFDSEKLAASPRKSWGVIGMRERASLLGGSFRIDSVPGKGTEVEVVIPYDFQSSFVSNAEE